MKGNPVTQAERLAVRVARSRGEPIKVIASKLGRHRRTVERILSADRTASDFKKAPDFFRNPRKAQGPATWTLETIRAARDDQLKGIFKTPVRLAEAFKTDDALFVPHHNRIAPQWAVETKLDPYPGREGERIAAKANKCITTPRSLLAKVHAELVDHGVSVCQNVWETSDDGTRTLVGLKLWPLEHVKYNSNLDHLETRTLEGDTIPIVHGDGTWVVFRKTEEKPWANDAALLPCAMILAAHTTGLSDWAGATRSHGIAKVVGQLGEGTAIMQEDGTLTPEADAFLDMLVEVASGGSEAGIIPPGGSAEFLTNNASAWQIFAELITSRERAAARVYLGTDASLGAVGDAPGVDISVLFGVATTKIQGDFEAIEQAIYTGVIQPWCAKNYGDSSHAPRFKYLLPDPDAEQKSSEEGAKIDRLLKTLEAMARQGFELTQQVVNDTAARLGVANPPKLAEQNTKRVPLELAPTDVARVVRVREARASQGLPPLGDERDELFLSELEQIAEAEAETQTAEEQAAAEAEAEIKVAEETDDQP